MASPVYSLSRALHDWLSRNRSQYGVLGALRHCAADLWEFALDSTPARRRARFGDIDFDCDYRVNTTAAGQRWQTRLRALLAGAPYQPSEPALFHQMMRALSLDFRHFAFMDLGSGKGRALLLAADYPFQRIVGVELLPELHEAALENIAHYHSPQQRCFSLESRCGNARDAEFPPEPLVIYLFNPLPEFDLARLIARLEESLRRHPRPVYIIYHNPLLEPVLARSEMLRKMSATHQYAIYASQSKSL